MYNISIITVSIFGEDFVPIHLITVGKMYLNGKGREYGLKEIKNLS